MSSPVVIWLRRDLRLTDHAPFEQAAREDRTVLALYLADHDTGEWTPGAASRWWLHHSLAALDADLRERGNRLVILHGDPLEALPSVARSVGAGAVWWHRLYEPATVQRDMRLKRALTEQGLEARSFAGALLHEPARFLKKDGTPFRVFTPFWKALSVELDPGDVLPPPARLASPDRCPEGIALEDLGLLPRIPWDAGIRSVWKPGEAGALERLSWFCADALDGYKETRDFPAVDGVSRLSPHLHFGEVSPRQVFHAARSGPHGESRGTEAWIREIGWREFAHAILFHFPHTPDQPMYEKYRDFPWREDHDALLEAWQTGRTGYPLVDAGMRELWATGWMHNRVRMVVASLLVKNLRIPWQKGARWFWDTLVDADLANNTMGWQWAAGCGADAAPYFRIFNPMRQQERFDPDGEYVRRWVPEVGTSAYPDPVVDFGASRDDALVALKRIGRLE